MEALGACTSTIKKFCRKVPGIYNIEDIKEFAVEGTERVMKSIKKNKTKVENLSNLHSEVKQYIIIPEQFSYSEEKKLMAELQENSIINAEVITFKRMAENCL